MLAAPSRGVSAAASSSGLCREVTALLHCLWELNVQKDVPAILLLT